MTICNRNSIEMSRVPCVSNTPSKHVQLIKDDILDLLLQWDILGDFHDHINKTESLLHRGLLRNAREVELKLAFVGEVSACAERCSNSILTRSS